MRQTFTYKPPHDMNAPDDDGGELVTWTPESMIEVSLTEPDYFLKVRETLTRIGESVRRLNNTLNQTCHILHKQGRYYIVHYKEMFMLDGQDAGFTFDDLRKRNTIVKLLTDWGMLTPVVSSSIEEMSTMKDIKIIPFKVKTEWTLQPLYEMGKRRAAA